MPPRKPRGHEASSSKATTELTADGDSPSWCQSQANQVRVGNMFLAHTASTSKELSAKWGLKWEEIPEEHACTTELFGHLASYLISVYRIDKSSSIRPGQLVGKKTGVALWSGLLNLSKKRFSHSQRPQTKVSCAAREHALRDTCTRAPCAQNAYRCAVLAGLL